MDPVGRFSDRAGDYVRYRPDYPAVAIDHILEGLGDPARLTAADVGAGTGISSRLIADRGVQVIAVEPNPAMRAAAAAHPRVAWREGTGEATGLDSASVDLVVCAQAFHWFRQREAIAEFHRVLRPRGRVAVMWNTRSRTDPLSLGYIEAIRAVNGEHPAETRTFEPGVVSADRLFTPAVLTTFDHAQALDRTGLIGRAASASYVPKQGEPYARLVRMFDALYERHRDANGLVTLRYVTEVWRAERAAQGADALHRQIASPGLRGER
jgi:SAM-dependent methyltransferase